MGLREEHLPMVVTPLSSRARDFLFVRPLEDGSFQAIHPLEILALDRTAEKIESLGRKCGPLALVLALCRLLVPCLRYRGSGRHLVVEPWSCPDLRGDTIRAGVRTTFARELAAEQAEAYRAVTAGEVPPEGTLPELFWATQTALPPLAPVFEDPDLGKLAKALYFHLVPEGEGMTEVDTAVTTAKVEACRAGGFAPLQLGLSPRQVQPLFRKLLSVTVRYASQVTGDVAVDLIRQRLRKAGRRKLSAAEGEMLALRYGACPALSDINVGFLFGCGPLMADLVNDYFLTLAGVRPADDRVPAEELLRLRLPAGRISNAPQAGPGRGTNGRPATPADPMPAGPRHQAEFQPDPSVPPAQDDAANREEVAVLEGLVPRLKGRDALRLQAFIDCNMDRKAAASRLGVEPAAFSRQLRQTVFPAIRKLARDEGFRPG